MFFFAVPLSDSAGNVLGWILIVLIFLSLAAAWVCVLLQQVTDLRRKKAKAQQAEDKKTARGQERKPSADATSSIRNAGKLKPRASSTTGGNLKGTRRPGECRRRCDINSKA